MPHLNLVPLTAEELQHLLGKAAAQRLLPDISSARLAGRPFPGPEVSGDLSFEVREERDWGASPEQSRAIKALGGELLGLGALPLGVFYAPELPEARHQRAYLLDDAALSLRWSETPSGPALPPFVQAVTLSRDKASGIAASLSSTSGLPFSPGSSEELDVRLLPGAPLSEFLAAHRNLAVRHGRGQKLSGEQDWMRAFQTVRQLNFQAWTRRGLLIRE
ncbi:MULTISPECIES: hypothetical protein [Deinococcus]|uniref:hypothetical protein n=1 Tax=Deinococcus TaxID=1298 RepID=UPI001CDC1523|nr:MULTISPECIES: hypothetical protein [Deinococcus]